VQVVAVVLLRNEDVYVERVLRNIAGFCDRIHVADHMSNDRTWDIVSSLARELDSVDATRITHAARSHDLVLPYIGTDTWVFSPDGDELFDTARLADLRSELEAGRYHSYFRIIPAMLHTISLDEAAGTAAGYLTPPARGSPRLFNFAALESWDGVTRERVHEGNPVYLDGWSWEAAYDMGAERGFDESPFRCLHACFLRRSSRDPAAGGAARLNIAESNSYRRDAVGRLAGAVRRLRRGWRTTSWKDERYRRGPVVTKDATPFLAPRT
jgi:hypothetical protein